MKTQGKSLVLNRNFRCVVASRERVASYKSHSSVGSNKSKIQPGEKDERMIKINIWESTNLSCSSCHLKIQKPKSNIQNGLTPLIFPI
jgi:hypothetical protein